MSGSLEGREGRRRRAAAAPVTTVLAVLCVAGFVATLGLCLGESAAPGDVLLQAGWSLGACRGALVDVGGLELARVWVDGEWWRVVSTGLLHGSLIHVTLNIWSLVAVGEWTERVWGHARTAVLFALSSVGGCLASLAWAEAPMVVGASAGIFGLAGALLVGRVLGRGQIAEELAPISVGMLGGCLAALLAVGYFVPVIAQAGHLGGLAVGAVLGLVWSRWGSLAGRLGVLAVGLGCAGLVSLGRWPIGRGGFDEFVGYRLLEQGEHEQAAAALERALAARPGDAALGNAVAYALAEAGVHLDRAFVLAEAALQLEPENADFLDTLGWIECRRGHVEEGLAALGRAEAAAVGPIPEVAAHQAACAGQ